MISFVVPAHNEQLFLGRTLEAIHNSARAVNQPYEIVVVDDASTDATAAVAREHGATVVPVNHRQIAATRNSGARAASGERLIFVDADTTINPRVAAAALRAMDKGAAGGGALARFEGTVPLYAHLLIWWLGLFMRLAGTCGGAFMFCTRSAFQATGGFNEKLFGAEDAAMSWALKRQGRFVVLWPKVLTSGRRTVGMHGLQMVAALIRMAFNPGMLTRRATVRKIWYDSNREANTPSSLAIRASNAAMLFILIAIITVPLWDLIPWSMTPRGSSLGKFRYAVAIFICHISLVLWPCAYYLLRGLVQQTRWTERIKITALLALCLWIAWGGAREVYWYWTGIIQQLLPATQG
ncbi:MAG TPA: glycosyltransferase [Lacipirellulaceae bacterium]|nr:glycosyltransferase [Lacipirellulaceae bacterium]